MDIMHPLSIIRLTAWLKRIALAQENTAMQLQRMADLYERDWEQKNRKYLLKPKMTEVQSFDQEEANKRWEKYQQAKESGTDES